MKKRLIGKISLVAVVLLLGVCAFLFSKQSDQETSNSPLGVRINNLEKDFGASPVDSSFRSQFLSSLLYDARIELPFEEAVPGSTKVPADPDGMFNLAWRFHLPSKAVFSMSHHSIDPGTSAVLVDLYGMPVFAYTDSFTIPDSRVELEPGIYRLTLQSSLPLDLFRLQMMPGGSSIGTGHKENQISLRELHLKIDPLYQFKLMKMIDLGMHSSEKEIIRIPDSKIPAFISHSEKKPPYEARIALSGRTKDHLRGDIMPSISVKFRENGSYFGITKFKLYRKSTKSGILDFVYLSVLRDMGFPVPRLEMVHLYLNKKSQGIYFLMETPSSAMFSAQKLQDANIVGIDVARLFSDYPLGGELELRYFNSVSENEKKYTTNEFLSARFSESLDPTSTAKLIAFLSAYSASHGMGVDDFRLQENLVTSRFIPIPRDLNPAGLSLLKGSYAYLTYAAWSLNELPLTTWPVKKLRRGGEEYSISEDLFRPEPSKIYLSDIHFVISYFLEKPENLALVAKYMRFFALNDFVTGQIRKRFLVVMGKLKASGQLDDWFRNQVELMGEMSDINKDILLTNTSEKMLINHMGSTYFWNKRNSESLDPRIRPSYISPMPIGLNEPELERQVVNNFLVEKKVFEILSHNGIKIRPSFRKIDNPAKIPIQLKSYKTSKTARNFAIKRNLITYLGRHGDKYSDLVLFLVRNAEEADGSYLTIRFRGETREITPVADKFFRLQGFREAFSSFSEIQKNYFAAGEPLRLVAFRLKKSSQTRYYNVLASPDMSLYMAYQMILPPVSGTIASQGVEGLSQIPKAFVKTRKGFLLKKSSEVDVRGHLVLPEGKTLTIEHGATLKFAPGATLEVSGNFQVLGQSDKPVTFKGTSPEPWGGLLVAGKRNKAVQLRIRHAKFENISKFPRAKLSKGSMTGAITCLFCKAEISDMTVSNTFGEDALHFISSVVHMRNSKVSNVHSDGIDSDYSFILLEDTQLSDAGGDGIDVSNSLILARGVSSTKSEDKGFSVGEISNVKIEASEFSFNKFGIANKDQSHIDVKKTRFHGNEQAFVEYIKKPYFGRPYSNFESNEFLNNKMDNSSLNSAIRRWFRNIYE